MNNNKLMVQTGRANALDPTDGVCPARMDACAFTNNPPGSWAASSPTVARYYNSLLHVDARAAAMNEASC